jgi:cytochrome c-type biogenesis protein CcmE
MKPHRKQRLFKIIGTLSLVSIIIGLVLYASEQSMNLFYTPSEIVLGKAPKYQQVRIGGLVKMGSIEQNPHHLLTTFIVTDNAHEVKVSYDKIMPDLFKEGKGVVVLGQLTHQKIFKASNVLAKHDENYKAPEVIDALERAARMNKKNTSL